MNIFRIILPTTHTPEGITQAARVAGWVTMALSAVFALRAVFHFDVVSFSSQPADLLWNAGAALLVLIIGYRVGAFADEIGCGLAIVWWAATMPDGLRTPGQAGAVWTILEAIAIILIARGCLVFMRAQRKEANGPARTGGIGPLDVTAAIGSAGLAVLCAWNVAIDRAPYILATFRPDQDPAAVAQEFGLSHVRTQIASGRLTLTFQIRGEYPSDALKAANTAFDEVTLPKLISSCSEVSMLPLTLTGLELEYVFVDAKWQQWGEFLLSAGSCRRSHAEF